MLLEEFQVPISGVRNGVTAQIGSFGAGGGGNYLLSVRRCVLVRDRWFILQAVCSTQMGNKRRLLIYRPIDFICGGLWPWFEPRVRCEGCKLDHERPHSIRERLTHARKSGGSFQRACKHSTCKKVKTVFTHTHGACKCGCQIETKSGHLNNIYVFATEWNWWIFKV